MQPHRSLLLLLLALPFYSQGQIRVTFSQQGAEVVRTVSGRLIKGVGVIALTGQNIGPLEHTVRAQELYSAAARSGISYISPSVALAMLERNAARSKAQLGLDGSSFGAGIIGVLGTGRVIPMGNGLALGLSLAPLAIPLIQRFFTSQLPATNVIRDHLLVSGEWKLDPAGLVGSGPRNGDMIPDGLLILSRYQGNWQPREVVIP